MDVEGERDADGAPASYRFVTRYPSDNAPTLALRLTGKVAASEHPFQMGDRTAVPPYAYPRRHIASDDVPTLIRAAWLRGVSALPNTFAHDSYIDELAALAGDDPLAYRLRYLDDERARAVLGAAAERAGWAPGNGARRPRTRTAGCTGAGWPTPATCTASSRASVPRWRPGWCFSRCTRAAARSAWNGWWWPRTPG